MRENYYRDYEPSNARKLFEQYLTEAPGDEDTPPDVTGPPDMPDDATNDPPPDIPDDDTTTDDTTDDGPPPDMGDDDSMDDFTNDDTESNEDEEGSSKKLGLDEKVSAIMNMNLYQRFMTMLTKITTQIGAMKNNMDVLHAITPEVIEVMESLSRLEENIRLYLKNNFTTENYSKNLLFFNKCLNLMKLLNDSFDKAIRKGIKEVK